MPKLERLLELARITRHRRVRSIRDMSRACGVSQRTIYRYLHTLSAMDIPTVLQSDARTARVGTDEVLEADDRCLIRYLVDYGPLAGQPFFASRLDRIRRILAPSPNAGGRRIRGRFIEVRLSRSPRRKSVIDPRLAEFSRALQRGGPVAVVTRTGRGAEVTLRPEVIRLSGGAVELRFRGAATGRSVRVKLEDIVSLRCLSGGLRSGRRGKKG